MISRDSAGPSKTLLLQNMNETLPLPEFNVEGGEGIDHGNDKYYVVRHFGGRSDGKTNTVSIYGVVQAEDFEGSRCLHPCW